MDINQPKNNWVLIPTIGILLFISLYLIASLYYPGGSNLNTTSKGFDWSKNYWCDLTMNIAKNGAVNDARPIALIAMFILCVSLAVFWFNLPRLFQNFTYRNTIRYIGISSMIFTFFLFTDLHDTIINVAGGLGFIALIITFRGLYQTKLFPYFIYGIICMLFMLFNYYIYETNRLIAFQPVIQKINFAFFLSWICTMNIHLYRRT